jgi:hypothetical protein
MAHALLKNERKQIIRRSRPIMKKLLTLLFALAVAFSLTMPVFAQEAPATTTTKAEKAKKTKASKATKATKAKKTKAAKTATTAPAPTP